MVSPPPSKSIALPILPLTESPDTIATTAVAWWLFPEESAMSSAVPGPGSWSRCQTDWKFVSQTPSASSMDVLMSALP